MIRLIVGLGNPGKEYEGTRHNFGRDLVQLFATDQGGRWRNWQGQRVARISPELSLLTPETYMNRSGEAVKAYCDYFEIVPQEVAVLTDELDLPLGKFEFRYGGYHAGHRGLESVTRYLDTQDYWRLRLGIGRPVTAAAVEGAGDRERVTGGKSEMISQYVLAHFRQEENHLVKKVIDETMKLLVDLTKNEPTQMTRSVDLE